MKVNNGYTCSRVPLQFHTILTREVFVLAREYLSVCFFALGQLRLL